MTDHTTSSTTEATLTEKELFSEFMRGETEIGSGKNARTVSVRELFSGYTGDTGDFEEVIAAIRENTLNDPDPTLAMEITIGELQTLMADVKRVAEGFERFKMQRLIETGHDQLPEELRYRATDIVEHS